MRLTTLSLLAILSFGAIGVGTATNAEADRDRRYDRRDDRNYRRPVYRDSGRRVYNGPVRANRRVVVRNNLYVNNGNFRFHNGHTVVYRRPTFNTHYYDVRFRPQIVVENYPAQHGHIWVSGHWNWTGAEWSWVGGHYAPDPSYANYYDDGSYE